MAKLIRSIGGYNSSILLFRSGMSNSVHIIQDTASNGGFALQRPNDSNHGTTVPPPTTDNQRITAAPGHPVVMRCSAVSCAQRALDFPPNILCRPTQYPHASLISPLLGHDVFRCNFEAFDTVNELVA